MHALFLHGTDGSPEDFWWPWLREQFQKSGYEVWSPELPDSHRPSMEKYNDFLSENMPWSLGGSVLVGHSSGATAALNLLMRDDMPAVKAVVLVGAFLNQRLTAQMGAFSEDQFDDLFSVSAFEPDTVRSKAERIYFVHSQNDPYCSYDDALGLARELGATFIDVPGGGHLAGSSGIVELPSLVMTLQADGILDENN